MRSTNTSPARWATGDEPRAGRLLRGHRGPLLVAAAVLAVLLPLWWQTVTHYERRLIEEQRARVSADLAGYGNALSSGLDRRFALLQGLKAFVQTTPRDDRFEPAFETFAAGLYAGAGGIRNFEVAPGAVSRYTYPLVNNVAIIGVDLRADPRPAVRADVQRAIDTRVTTVSGPMELRQGGLGLTAFQPIYDVDRLTDLVTMSVNLPPLLREAGLDKRPGSPDLALRDADSRVFHGPASVFALDPVTVTIVLPDTTWELAAMPENGWHATITGPLRLYQWTGFAVVLLVVGVVYLGVNRQTRLAQAVRERTSDLLVANAALEHDIVERERAEAQLREQEALYRGVFEKSGDGIVITDIATNLIVDANPAMCAMHGYTREEFIGLFPPTFIHPDSHHLFEEYIATTARGGYFWAQAKDVRKDGTVFPVEVHGTAILYDGRPRVLAVVRDVTEQVETQHLLEQRVEERTRELTTLLDISHSIAATLELQAVVALVLERLHDLVPYRSAALLVFEDDEVINLGHRTTDAAAPPPRFTATTAGIAEVRQLGKPVIMRQAGSITVIPQRAGLTRVELGPTRQANLPTPGADCWLGVPLVIKDEVVGVLSLEHEHADAYSERDANLALAIADHAAIAVENARLYDQAQELAALEERQHLARELHDSVTQSLFSMTLMCKALPRILDRDVTAARERIDRLNEVGQAALAEMRALIYELRPESLEREGLVAALKRQAEAVRARHNLAVEVDLCDEPDLGFDIKQALFRIAQEAMHNTVKHAHAQRIDLRLDRAEDFIELEVIDDGDGFDTTVSAIGHVGLHSMRERAARLGGVLTLDSQPGAGARVRARIPCRRVAPATPAEVEQEA